MITISSLITRAAAGALLSPALLAATACGGAGPPSAPPPPSVVTAFYPLTEAVTRIGGDRLEVADITPPGSEPHDVELTPAALDRVIDADLVVYVGAGFQPALEAALPRARGEIVDVLDGLPLDEGVDPHVWLDPWLWMNAVEAIAETLERIDAEGASLYRDGAAAYASELERLDEEFERGLGACERDLIVTSHASFGYLAARYGLRQEAVSGLTPEAEPDPRRLAELADLVAEEGVTTVFADVFVSPDVARTLAREAGVDVGTLDPIEMEPEDGYLGAMRRNLGALREALGCG